jgi:hypothetical protein
MSPVRTFCTESPTATGDFLYRKSPVGGEVAA